MSPPEVWGPTVWAFFHTLAHKVNEHQSPIFFQQIFGKIKTICQYLPCPQCSQDATAFLAKTNVNDIKTKQILIDKLYIFHNYVNNKKKKKLFNYSNINKYNNNNLISVYNNFITNYNTRGNMKLLAETFQRSLIIADLKKWITQNIRRFFETPVTTLPDSPGSQVQDESQVQDTRQPIVNQLDCINV